MWLILLISFFTFHNASVLKESIVCSPNEFACNDGACVSLDRVCNGFEDCADGTDETACDLQTYNDRLHSDRNKRQTQCRKSQFTCRDGTCINFDGKCDGSIDCPDKSDESHALCYQLRCQSNWFRCTYGACVDGSAPCNGISECADNSDEVMPQCTNSSTTPTPKGRFACTDGTTISKIQKCDGVADCPDGSDEILPVCGRITCPRHLFQCSYGACTDNGSNCNGVNDCADGSDESDELCNRIGTGSTKPSVTVRPPQRGTGNCILPPYPAHGSYKAGGSPTAKPGDAFETIGLNISCNDGFGLDGSGELVCFNGQWFGDMPQCVRFCKLQPHPSVIYKCTIPNAQQGFRNCSSAEPSGTTIIPECKAPNYYSVSALPAMHCIDGSWDYLASQRCQPECGVVTSQGTGLIINGQTAQRGELPWHVGIYTKTTSPYMQICGGSIVSTTLVISAAHCFYDTSLKPSKNYAVAAGKIYRPWKNARDDDPQQRDVSDIKIPDRYIGVEGNYQSDIALVIVSQAFQYKVHIRPVCLNFEINFNNEQLVAGNDGKVAGWGLTSENGNASQILKVVDLPYVPIRDCLVQAPNDFRGYITSDKICAGRLDGTALCRGDSGGGLVFPSVERSVTRYYLRGIVSTAPRQDEKQCNAYSLTAFTQIQSLEWFITQYYSVD